MIKRTFQLMAAGLVLSLGMLATGCSSSQGRITASDIRSNMTPELKTTAMTSEQHKTRVVRSVDHNLRQVWDDLDYIFLVDKPSHLTPYPIP